MGEIDRKEFFVDADTGMKLMVISKIPRIGRLGQAVLLVHGSGVGWPCWDIPLRDYSVMDFLAERGLDVYALECRGYGRSTKPNGMEVSADTMATDIRSVLLDIMKMSEVDRVSGVGHSSGGTTLLVTGGRYPELLDRMVIIGTPYKKINPMFLDYAQKVIDSAKVQGGLYPDIINNPAIEAVRTIKVPTLILNGSNEYVVDPDDALAMFRDLDTRDKSIVTQPCGFHLMFVEKRGHIGIQESILFWVIKK
jgi:alpha-beta hydrolase superfamily lysophospholipase